MPGPTPDYADDPGIRDGESVLRRIPPRHYVRDSQTNQWIVSSAAFDDSGNGSPMSTARETLVPDVNIYLAPHKGYGLARISVRTARELGQRVTQQPTIHGQPEHTWIAGKKTKGTMRSFRNSSPLIREPAKIDSAL